MKQVPDIYAKLAALQKENIKAALCMVTGTFGSSPRKAGAKMIVLENKEIFGSVGGGRFELEVIEEAVKAIALNQAKKLSYKLGDVDDPACSSTMEIFIDPVISNHHLILFGYGHVGRALAGYVRDFGFRVTLADHREGIFDGVDGDRFTTIQATYPDIVGELEFDDDTFIVVTTSEHMYDFEVTALCAKKPHAYLGMIGSIQKIEKASSIFRERGLTEEEIQAIDMPMGLKMHCKTPHEIAISILAKLIDIKNRPAGSTG